MAHKTIAKSKKVTSQSLSLVGWFNIVLMGCIVIFLAANLYISNSLVSRRFAIERMRTDLHTLSTSVATQEGSLKSSEDLANLVILAKSNGMVANSGNDALYAPSDVAFGNAQTTKE